MGRETNVGSKESSSGMNEKSKADWTANEAASMQRITISLLAREPSKPVLSTLF